MMQSLKCYLVDDEINAIENLQGLLEKHCPQAHVAGYSGTVQEAVDFLSLNPVDVLFLDIRMRNETGFDLLERLPAFEGSLIFVTAHDEYGLKAIKFSATDYILKPINVAELISAMDKAGRKKNQVVNQEQIKMLLQSVANQPKSQQTRIALPDADEIRYINIADIVYCKSSNSYTTFYFTGNNKITVSRSISEYESLLSPYGFIRTHQSYLVNKLKIHSFKKEDGGYLSMEDGTIIPVSRQRRGILKDLF
jgi:two-component system, LytTR family, response regulator